MIRKIFLVLGIFFTVSALAGSNIAPKVYLESIKTLQQTEKHGDELYLTVTSFPSYGKARHLRIPDYPLFWPGRSIDKIQNKLLWNEVIQEGQSVRLLISLIEQDSPPWNLDDEIGSVSLKLHNQSGKLDIAWERSNSVEDSKLSLKNVNKGIAIEFSGHGQTYKVILAIKK